MKSNLALRISPFLAAILAAGCGGDDGSGNPVDSSTIDASTIDAPRVVDAPLPGGPGDLCSNAEPVVLAGGTATITATTAAPYNHNYEPGVCAEVNSLGPDRVHSITIPAGQRLTATVDPTSAMYDPGIFLIAGPAGSCDAVPIVCLTQNDAGGDGQNDAITFDNPAGGQPKDVFIMIDGFRAEGEAYTLTVTVGAIP